MIENFFLALLNSRSGIEKPVRVLKQLEGEENLVGKVLILSNSLDAHADVVEEALRDSSHSCIRLDTDLFVDKGGVSFSEMGEGQISIGDNTCSLQEISSVLYRRPMTPVTGVKEEYQRKFAEGELEELLRQLHYLLEHALWVSPTHALEAARRKLPQLALAQRLGLRVPKTLASNSPQQIKEFVRECGGRVAYKTLHSPVLRLGEGSNLWGVPTTILEEEHLSSIELIRPTGGIFQEYVEKAYEVRVTVIGEEFFAAKIDSQPEPTAHVDWREAVALGKVQVTQYSPPAEITNACHAMVRGYGLRFGAIDLIREPSGSYRFLEINCNGQWLWVEECTQQPLVQAMVRLLTSR